MTFNSWQFLIFFPVVVSLYFAIPFRFRWVLLLAASYFFYMCWRPEYVLLIIFSTLVDYAAGLWMERAPDKRARRKFLIMSLVVNLGLLFFFKYFNFFSESLHVFLARFRVPVDIPHLDVLLPVGISFYTFQTLSYTIEVYRGRIKAEHHLGVFAVYVSFFPQLVAGPIERAQHLLPQFKQKFDFDYQRVTDGLKLMLWGMFEKVVIADRLAILVDQVYSRPENHHGPALVIATVFFAFQIFCDFSGYSNIAIGAARVFGISLMQNFRRPYFASSVADFWQRWHISLSTWFRDYVYIPLGGNRCSQRRWGINILLTFLLSGLWHGANWTFLFWGLLHGTYYLMSRLTSPLREALVRLSGLSRWPRLHRALQSVVVFLLVTFAWIFFRAGSMEQAGYIISHLGTGWDVPLRFGTKEGTLGMRAAEFLWACVLIVFLEVVHAYQSKGNFLERFNRQALVFRWLVYIQMSLIIMNFGVAKSVPFIYFQF